MDWQLGATMQFQQFRGDGGSTELFVPSNRHPIFYRINESRNSDCSKGLKQNNGRVCCSSKEGSPVLKFAVSGVTELLRILSWRSPRSNETAEEPSDERLSVRDIEDLVAIIESDYQRAYFLTGNFTSTIYAEDCLFEDPTIKFSGRDLYKRNLELLVPFFDHPFLELKEIKKCISFEVKCIQASWKLRTYLNLPWRPLISIEGTTDYYLDEELKIVRHAETWNVSPVEAVLQIFRSGTVRHKK